MMRTITPLFVALTLIAVPGLFQAPDTLQWAYALLLACCAASGMLALSLIVLNTPLLAPDEPMPSTTQRAALVCSWLFALGGWYTVLTTKYVSFTTLGVWIFGSVLCLYIGALVDTIIRARAKVGSFSWAPEPVDVLFTWEQFFGPYAIGCLLPSCAVLVLHAWIARQLLFDLLIITTFAVLPLPYYLLARWSFAIANRA